MSSVFNYIALAVPNFLGTCKATSDSSAILTLPVKFVDGRTLDFVLELQQIGALVTIKECVVTHLPAFCPERHINRDGTFCLYYSAAGSLVISDEASAIDWMETVYKFLKLQDRARVKRMWPNKSTWAHGEAARHQMRALETANHLGAKIAEATAKNHMSITRKRSGGRSILEVRKCNEVLYRVWEFKGRVINLKQRCFCGISGRRRPKRLRRCGQHAIQAFEFALALRDWENSEKEFWEQLRGASCCQTCDNCPLKDAG